MSIPQNVYLPKCLVGLGSPISWFVQFEFYDPLTELIIVAQSQVSINKSG